MHKIEYRVIPVTRYFVTRYVSETDEQGRDSGGCEPKGEYENEQVAHEVAYALCKAEHDALGWPIGDERISYPDTYRKAAEAMEAKLLA